MFSFCNRRNYKKMQVTSALNSSRNVPQGSSLELAFGEEIFTGRRGHETTAQWLSLCWGWELEKHVWTLCSKCNSFHEALIGFQWSEHSGLCAVWELGRAHAATQILPLPLSDKTPPPHPRPPPFNTVPGTVPSELPLSQFALQHIPLSQNPWPLFLYEAR